MATIEVSTWAELRSAITSAGVGDTIKLIADIDCNDEIPEGVSSTITILDKNLTIDGGYVENGVTKRHEIRNLRTSASSPVSIFKIQVSYDGKYTNTIKNIDFINLILDAPLFETAVERTEVYLQKSFFNVPYYGSTQKNIALSEIHFRSLPVSKYLYFYITNCRFTGKRTTKILRYNSSATINRFYIYADYCYIKTKYTGTYNPSYDEGTVYSELYNMSLNGCRIEGDIIGNAGDTTYINFNLRGAVPSRTISMQNVYDVDFYISSAVSDRAVDFTANKGLIKKPVKVWNDTTTTTYTNYNAKADLIFATESEMQDSDWLIQNNFDVVPSNT